MNTDNAVIKKETNNKSRRLSGKTLRYLVLSGILPLLIGMCLYIYFCPNVIFVKALTKLIGLHVSENGVLPDSIFESFLRNHLLDFLWAQAFSTMILVICLLFDLNIRNCILTCAALCVFSEVIQLFKFVKLTFDFIDILAQLCGLGIALAYFTIITRRSKNEKNN